MSYSVRLGPLGCILQTAETIEQAREIKARANTDHGKPDAAPVICVTVEGVSFCVT